ncbi:peptidoglycan amidohydrolase family protein [Bacillus sp. JJ722]|uniref:peptidoglycan amidohydrolase family protein n=1 Tax=Bacillus sp. JJ722 TaxID=3122973 RepID=UPI00300069F2
MKKLNYLFLSIILLFSMFSMSLTAKALSVEETDYNTLLNEGILDESITHEMWEQSKLESEEALKNRENDLLEEDVENEEVNSLLAKSGYKMKKGDIFISNRTSSKGLTGHSAIAVSDEKILHIRGYNHTTQLLTLKQWKDDYGKKDSKTWTKVYRIKNTDDATKAGTWAYRNYYNPNGGASHTIKPKYGLGGGNMVKDPTYCSKIVWQAYRTGLGRGDVIKPPFSGLIMPYSLPDYFTSSYTPKLVANF